MTPQSNLAACDSIQWDNNEQGLIEEFILKFKKLAALSNVSLPLGINPEAVSAVSLQPLMVSAVLGRRVVKISISDRHEFLRQLWIHGLQDGRSLDQLEI